MKLDFHRTNPGGQGLAERLSGLPGKRVAVWLCLIQTLGLGMIPHAAARERISINDNWRFVQGEPTNRPVSLLYDVRRGQTLRSFAAEVDGNAAINESVANETTNATAVIKQWILPTSNEFIKDPSRRFVRPEGNLGDGGRQQHGQGSPQGQIEASD